MDILRKVKKTVVLLHLLVTEKYYLFGLNSVPYLPEELKIFNFQDNTHT
jgi:hypothetical protein